MNITQKLVKQNIDEIQNDGHTYYSYIPRIKGATIVGVDVEAFKTEGGWFATAEHYGAYRTYSQIRRDRKSAVAAAVVDMLKNDIGMRAYTI